MKNSIYTEIFEEIQQGECKIFAKNLQNLQKFVKMQRSLKTLKKIQVNGKVEHVHGWEAMCR